MRLHYTSTRIDRPVGSGGSEGAGSSTDLPVPGSLMELFDALSTRRVTGSAADRLVAGFLAQHGVQGRELVTFRQLLDRNLVAGFRSKTLDSVPWPDSVASPSYPLFPSSAAAKSADAARAAAPAWSKPTGSWEISVALGLPLKLPYEVAGKLASRKYDGVRVIAIVDFVGGAVHAVRFLSRQGNEFASLSRLEEAFRGVKTDDLPAKEKYRVDVLEGPNHEPLAETGGAKYRLVLDGEVCALADGKEDFLATVSQIRRQATMEQPTYLVFDALTWGEFSSASGTRLLCDRLSDLDAVASAVSSPLVRAIEQARVRDDAHLATLVAEAAERGWEGLILRADVGYRGKRSGDIRKLKAWAEGEFTVVARAVGRIALAGRVQDACTSLTVEHRGHPVSVGSGLSAAQRLRFLDAHAIVGKQVTVQYFEETEKSLRFPTVKRVWDGERDV